MFQVPDTLDFNFKISTNAQLVMRYYEYIHLDIYTHNLAEEKIVRISSNVPCKTKFY